MGGAAGMVVRQRIEFQRHAGYIDAANRLGEIRRGNRVAQC
jgi:hypothetical protein